ncbi:MAG: peptidylprolyl isomerase [Verrucomicrobia bacterium]|nr:MAG: peptidylprolyl isomerase [Verrucomicrobiota bacterium]
MKIIFCWIALCASSQAALIAEVQTTVGNISVELQFDKTPKTVANFMLLAQGTGKTVDVLNGAVRKKQFYVGEKFFRVVNEATFRIAQTGSGNGTNSGGGPGYTFQDEFHPSLTHVPYVLSMANSGPNSNSSQIFFVGNSSPSHLNSVHTVFGLITDAASRATIDAIHAAGNNGSTITGITFSRTDPAAIVFDEQAQALPQIKSLPGNMNVVPNTHAKWLLSEPTQAGDILAAYGSENLTTWTKASEYYHAPDESPTSEFTLGNASKPKQFFYLSKVFYPAALGQSSLANRTMIVGVSQNSSTITLTFNAAGKGGTILNSLNPSSPGTFTVFSYENNAYNSSLIINNTIMAPLLIRSGLDTKNSTHILGRNNTQRWNGFSWTSQTSGSLSITL